MRVLIAVLSCWAMRHYEDSIRNTWAKEVPEGVDYRFFLGEPQASAAPDEVFLPVQDTFDGVTHKVVAMLQWALDQEYSHVFKADLDTLIRPASLLQSGFEQYDWVGGQNGFFLSGGGGYWLSRKAMQCVVATPIEGGQAEDVNVARVLLANGIELQADARYLFYPGSVMNDQTLTMHLSSVRGWNVKATPQMMLDTWEDQKNRVYKRYTSELEVKFTRALRRFR
jgi:hypothetical protein